MDWSQRYKEPIFTFLVGPEEERFVGYPVIIAAASEPMQRMVTNGMRESIDMQVHMRDVEPATFTLFLDYAYQKMYRAPERPEETRKNDASNSHNLIGTVGSQATSLPSVPLSRWRFCRRCGSPAVRGKCSAAGCLYRNIGHSGEPAPSLYCVQCGTRLVSDQFENTISCDCLNQWRAKIHIESGRTFRGRSYHLDANGHRDLANLSPPDEPTDEVRCHAKLYVFADKWMVEFLKKLCLHKLHRDLVTLDVSQNVAEVVKLLKYTYEHTAQGWGDWPGVGKDLRDLFMAYAVWKENELLEHDDFDEFLTSGGEGVRDFGRQSSRRIQVDGQS